VERFAIDFAEDGDAADAEFAAGPQDADGDFSAISDEDFLEHEDFLQRDAGRSLARGWVAAGLYGDGACRKAAQGKRITQRRREHRGGAEKSGGGGRSD
jgi:hypothetical protein